MTDTTKQTQAASDDDLIRRGDVLEIQMLGVTVTRIERAIRDITKHDPLSDPRVVALVEAAKRALNNLENTESEFGITLESADSVRTALRAIGGEA